MQHQQPPLNMLGIPSAVSLHSVQKWLLTISIALAVCFGLFVFMASLIKQPPQVIDVDQPILPDVMVSLRKSPPEPPKDIRPLPEPKKATPPPKRQTVDIHQSVEITRVQPNFDPSLISIKGIAGVSEGGASRLFKRPAATTGNNDATPIVQITPQYPIDAARKGIEGWVKLSFSINKTGSVTNINILEAEPQRVFNRAATKALKGWRYKAKFVDGVPMIQHNLSVILEFNIDNQ